MILDDGISEKEKYKIEQTIAEPSADPVNPATFLAGFSCSFGMGALWCVFLLCFLRPGAVILFFSSWTIRFFWRHFYDSSPAGAGCKQA